ncbi:MAG: NUDIX domain-containing protein [Candidatus Paceibacterales bacterium]
MDIIGLIKSKTRRKILRFFFSHKEKKYYLRELERILSLPVGNIRRELISFERFGLFNRKKMGNLTYYSLNKNSPLFEVIENIILKPIDTKKKKKVKKELKKDKDTNLTVIRRNDLNILLSRVGELENILETFLQRESEVKDFLNLGVVINNQGKVLLVRRVKQEEGTDGSVLTWVFPGGRQRLNESRSESVAREVLTETGYKIKSIKEISFRLHPQFPVFITYHLCKLVSPKPVAKPKEPHEIAEIRWVKPKEIKELFTTDFDPKVKRELGLR